MIRFYFTIIAVLTIMTTGCGRPHDGRDGAPGESVQGPQGDPGQSIVGPSGPVGATGSPGINGTNGVNAPATTIVQLCPGFVAAYPNVFPEVALCLNHKLYGVYSANDGFMVLMPPGAYSSNGINASCTFTVKENCVVVP